MAKLTQDATSIRPEVLAGYEPVIGLEVHAQLKTATKAFCACSTRFGDPPNTNTCPVCLGLPGALPVLNRRAVELGMRAALALHLNVQESSRFARKNYFYPDLPKGYQISMYELPLATAGWLEIQHDGQTKRIGITRLHLEDDAAKNLHEGFPDSDEKSYVDYNRGGTPLAEIVSEPDLLPVRVSAAWRNEIAGTLPELPEAKRRRFVRDFGITPYDAEVLASTRALADYFEAVVRAGAPAKPAANWIQVELLRQLNDAGREITESPVQPAELAALIAKVEGGEINAATGKKVFARMFETGKPATEIIAAEGFSQISDTGEIERWCHEVIEKNPDNVAKYLAGNEGVFKFFVGQVMRASRGQANPQTVNDTLKRLLS